MSNKNKFKIGDEVVVNGGHDGVNFNKERGKLIGIASDDILPYLVEFYKPRDEFHSGSDKGKREHCYWVNNVEKVMNTNHNTDITKYNFRTNNFSLERVVDDAIEDQKTCFLVIGQNNCLFGCLKVYDDIIYHTKWRGKSSFMSGYLFKYDNELGKFVTDYKEFNRYEQPYWLNVITKEDIPEAIKVMKEIKIADENRKEELKHSIKPKRNCKERSTNFKVITI